MKRVHIQILALGLFILLCLTACGKTPVYRWHSGNPTSFAFADGNLIPVDRQFADEAMSKADPKTGEVDVKDYGRLNVTFRQDAVEHRAHYETLGTYIDSYTPETLPVAVVKVACLKSNSDEGFWVVQTNEGVFGKMEFLDFTNPIFIHDNLLWQPGLYDILLVTFGIGGASIGGETIQKPVIVTAPGYTDLVLPDILRVSTQEDGSVETIGYERKYVGDNIFHLGNLEGPIGLNNDTYFMFRQEIRTAEVLEVDWWKYADGSPVEGAHEWGGYWDDNPHSIPWYTGNTWFWNQPWGGGWMPNIWVDCPFQGLAIDEDTNGLEIVIRWDLANMIELWDFTDEGLQFVLSPDYMDRFSMEITQIK